MAHIETVKSLKPLLYGGTVSWKMLTDMYGNMPYF
jgi:hypothetical protein